MRDSLILASFFEDLTLGFLPCGVLATGLAPASCLYGSLGLWVLPLRLLPCGPWRLILRLLGSFFGSASLFEILYRIEKESFEYCHGSVIQGLESGS
jgi:hypothetical protein